MRDLTTPWLHACEPKHMDAFHSTPIKCLDQFHKDTSHFADVEQFHKKFDQLVHTKPTHLTRRKLQERIDFMQEELDEFTQGADEIDMAQMGDALVDLVYVALGTAVQMGLPWHDLWDDVQRANMEKVRGVGKRGHLVDCIKPPGWQPPHTQAILEAAGYHDGLRAEEHHVDDPIHQ